MSDEVDATPDRDEELDRSPTLGKLFEALSQAQGMMKPAKKDSKNPHFGNTYASLDSVWDAIREPLSKHGLSIIQGTSELPGGGTRITTTLGHSSGEWMRSSLTLILTAVGKPTDPITMQALGSALSYGRRYGMSMVGVVTDTDDDGEAASRSAKKESAPKPISMGEVTHVCSIHKVDFKRYSKPDGEVWYSHKLPDGKWCNEGKAEAGKKPEEPATAPSSVPATSGKAPKPDDVKAVYDADLAELATLKTESGLTDQQVVTRIRNQFSNREFKQLTPSERQEVKAMLRAVIAAHKESEAEEDRPF